MYHLIAGGRPNWHLLDAAIAKIESARAEGLVVTSDMHPYISAHTELAATVPAHYRAGGPEAFLRRLRDPATRAEVRRLMVDSSVAWDNVYLWAGPNDIVITDVPNPALNEYIGTRITEIAAEWGVAPEDATLDFLIRAEGNAGAIYFVYSENNIRRKTTVPWIAFCSDQQTWTTDAKDRGLSTHPRGYGSFARILGRFVRDEQTLTMSDAIRRLSSFPAEILQIRRRGWLKPGYFADVTIFDPARIQDHATYEDPHQYATGVIYVLVNGEPVVANGEHTGALPGRAVRGPGWNEWDG